MRRRPARCFDAALAARAPHRRPPGCGHDRQEATAPPPIAAAKPAEAEPAPAQPAAEPAAKGSSGGTRSRSLAGTSATCTVRYSGAGSRVHARDFAARGNSAGTGPRWDPQARGEARRFAPMDA
jgi:hypothetical protein